MKDSLAIYKTSENEKKLMTIYNERIKSWPAPCEELDIPTQYGTTHIVVSGKKDAPPVFMIHAMLFNATMWQQNVAELSSKFRVYAVDTIGDLGKSRLSDLDNYPKSGKEYSDWLSSLFDALGVKKAFMAGASMGGWIVLNHAIYAPDRIESIFLLSSMGLLSEDATARVLTTFTSGQMTLDELVIWVLGNNPKVLDDWADYLRVAMTCSGRGGFPFTIPDHELELIKVPVLLFLGDEDGVVGDPKEVAKRAKKCISDIKIEILPNASSHIINAEYPEIINSNLIEFLETSIYAIE